MSEQRWALCTSGQSISCTGRGGRSCLPEHRCAHLGASFGQARGLETADLLLAWRPALTKHGRSPFSNWLAGLPPGWGLQDLSPYGDDGAWRITGVLSPLIVRGPQAPEKHDSSMRGTRQEGKCLTWRAWQSTGVCARRNSRLPPTEPTCLNSPWTQLQSLDLNKPVLVEAESSKVGEIHIPTALWKR